MQNEEKKVQSHLLSFETEPGIKIAAEGFGNPEHPPVLLLHGGGQTRHSWGDTALVLASKGWYAVGLDARGHGDSSWSPDGTYKEKLFEDLVHILSKHFPQKPALVGASMGGITSLIAEGESSESLSSALVLVDIAPRVEQKGVERIFKFMSSNLDGFADIEEAADAVAAYLPHRPRPESVKRLEKNLRKRENGRYYWHWDPKILEGWKKTTPEDTLKNTQRLYKAAQALKVPALIVRGGMSDVVSEQVMAEFLDLVPGVRSVDVSGAGHMVAGDSNHRFSEAVIEFLTEVYPPINS